MASPQQIIEHSNTAVDYTIYDAKWIPFSARLVTLGSHAKGTGALEVYEMSAGKLQRTAKVSLALSCVYYHH